MDFPMGFHWFDSVPSRWRTVPDTLNSWGIVNGCLYPEYAVFIIYPDTVGSGFEFHLAANGTFFVVGACFSLKPRVRFMFHEGKELPAVPLASVQEKS